MDFQALANEMGVTVGDLFRFVTTLKTFMEEGTTFEEAIAKSDALSKWSVEHAVELAREMKPIAVEAFSEEAA